METVVIMVASVAVTFRIVRDSIDRITRRLEIWWIRSRYLEMARGIDRQLRIFITWSTWFTEIVSSMRKTRKERKEQATNQPGKWFILYKSIMSPSPFFDC